MAKNDRPQSDIAPPDTIAPIPVMPAIPVQDVPAISEDQQADDIATQADAAPYWAPAWHSVEKKFVGLLESYDGNNVEQFKDLEPLDFKARVLANQIIHTEIKKIMEDIKSAVEAIEQQPSRPKPPKSSTGT